MLELWGLEKKASMLKFWGLRKYRLDLEAYALKF